MKKIIFFFVILFPFFVSAQHDSARSYELELKDYNLELDLAKVKLSVDPQALKYEKYFHEAYNKPDTRIEVERVYNARPGWPKAWHEKTISEIAYKSDEFRIKFYSHSEMPTSLELMSFFLVIVFICLIVILFFRDDDDTTYFIILVHLFSIIFSFIGALIMEFGLTAFLLFLSFLALIPFLDLAERREGEGARFYIAWAIALLIFIATVIVFVLGK